MAEANPELQAKLQELDHELEVRFLHHCREPVRFWWSQTPMKPSPASILVVWLIPIQ